MYSDIIADGDAVSEHSFYLPETIDVKMDKDGKHYYNHLFVDERTGYASIKLNGWESGLIEEEAMRADFVCWLRNPPRERWALCIPYEKDGETRPAYPDFVIVRRDERLGYVIDILEPHNPEYKDNLGKAKGLAAYAEKEYQIGRIQLVREAKDAAGKERLKRLDFSKGEVRKKVLKESIRTSSTISLTQMVYLISLSLRMPYAYPPWMVFTKDSWLISGKTLSSPQCMSKKNIYELCQ